MRYSPDVIINVAGLSGCGKSTLISDTFGTDWAVFRPSDILRDNAERVGIPITKPSDYIDIHDSLEAENPDFMVDSILHLRGKVVLDGLRVHRHVAKIAEVMGPALFTTYLTCKDELRLQRVQSRLGRPEGAPQSIEELYMRDAISIPENYEFDKVAAMANLPCGSFDTSGNRVENAVRYGLLVRSLVNVA
jgi:cytidylate kinase